MLDGALTRDTSEIRIYETKMEKGKLVNWVSMEKQRALFFIYCLVEFRNNKAMTFNILYLTAADFVRNRWKDLPYFAEAVDQLITTLRCNAPLSKLVR